MRILIVQDFAGWAIGQLSDVIVRHNVHHEIKTLSIHPRELRQTPEVWRDIFKYEVERYKPDLIHFQYWGLVKELEGITDVPMILTHHNQKNLLSEDWSKMKKLIVHTQKAKKTLNDGGYDNVEVIQHGIDIEKFEFLDEYDPENKIIGYVGRIVPWKGLVEILKSAKELATKVIMMGRIDKGSYWKLCQPYVGQMDIRFNTPDEEQVKVYHEMGVYVGNSIDGIEEGTLPLLEAMACGIPVITTPSGEAKDIIKHGKNGLLCEFEDRQSLKSTLDLFFEMTPEEKNTMREEAWQTVKNMSEQVMARKYEKVYYSVVYEKNLVSVIIPTYNRDKTITKVLDGYAQQTYKPIELIVVDDNSNDKTFATIEAWKMKNKDIPLKYINTLYAGYGLGQARNHGIFRAGGNYLIFNDDRFVPLPTAVKVFISRLSAIKELSAVWGDKGAGKRDFIENFFAVRKKHIVQAGMFNERINEYGGQSQEVRERLRNQGFNLQYEPAAISTAVFGTHNRANKRYEVFRSKLKLWELKN